MFPKLPRNFCNLFICLFVLIKGTLLSLFALCIFTDDLTLSHLTTAMEEERAVTNGVLNFLIIVVVLFVCLFLLIKGTL